QRSFSSQQGLGTNYTAQAGIGGFELTSKAFPGFPGLFISGYQGIDGNLFTPGQFRENNYNYRDLMTIAKGRHFIEIGAEYLRHSAFGINGLFGRGVFNFIGNYTGNGWGDYLLGLPLLGTRSFATSLFGDYMNHFEPFVQDTWKV